LEGKKRGKVTQKVEKAGIISGGDEGNLK